MLQRPDQLGIISAHEKPLFGQPNNGFSQPLGGNRLALAGRVRTRRLAQRWTQVILAQRSGVSLGSLKRFESTGQIALESLLKLAFALDAMAGIDRLFVPPAYQTLDDVLQADGPKRKRGSRS